jgi:hypothetical protein
MLPNAAFGRTTRLAALLGVPLALLIQTRCSSEDNGTTTGAGSSTTASDTSSTSSSGPGSGGSGGSGGSSSTSTGTAGTTSSSSTTSTAGTGGGGATGSGGTAGTSGTGGVDGGSKGGSGGTGGSVDGGSGGAGTGGKGGAGGSAGAPGGAGGVGGAGGGVMMAAPCTSMPAEPPPALKKGPAIGPFGAGAGQIVGVPGEATLYVIGHRNGNVYAVIDGTVSPTNLAHVDIATAGNNEQGLLSMALHPDFANNHLFYLYYTAAGTGAMTIDEYERMTPTSSRMVRNIYSHARADGNCTAGNCFHNGGTLFFNPKDTMPYLYFSIGNNTVVGQSAQANGFAGRVLRFDLATKMSTTYAYGLRNPYRMSIDRGTGDMWIGEVADGPGGSVFFLANGAAPGHNFGYGNGGEIQGGISGLQGSNAAMIGGVVYRGNKIAGLCGRYFFGLHDPGIVRSLVQTNGARVGGITNHATLNVPGKLTSFGEDGEGELYVSSMDMNVIYKIVEGP